MRMSQSTSRTSALRDVGRAGEALDGPVLALPGDDLGDVEAGRVVDAAGRVGHGDDGRALLADQPGRDRAGVAEALDRDARLGQVHAEVAGRLDDGVDAAAGRRLVAALGAAEADRLAGDDARDRVAGVHRVGVHHPGHDLGVGVDVRRRDVLLGPDQDLDLGEEAPGQALELLLAELLGIDDHAALAAAVRDADDRALPGHPHREGLDLVERDVLVVADAALGRAAAEVVLDAIAGEDLDGAVVHVDREMDGELAARLAQDEAHAGIQAEALGREVELSLRDFPRVDPRSDVLGCHGRCVLTCRAVIGPPSVGSSPGRPHGARRRVPKDRSRMACARLMCVGSIAATRRFAPPRWYRSAILSQPCRNVAVRQTVGGATPDTGSPLPRSPARGAARPRPRPGRSSRPPDRARRAPGRGPRRGRPRRPG